MCSETVIEMMNNGHVCLAPACTSDSTCSASNLPFLTCQPARNSISSPRKSVQKAHTHAYNRLNQIK
jgi:hypothetical protein